MVYYSSPVCYRRLKMLRVSLRKICLKIPLLICMEWGKASFNLITNKNSTIQLHIPLQKHAVCCLDTMKPNWRKSWLPNEILSCLIYLKDHNYLITVLLFQLILISFPNEKLSLEDGLSNYLRIQIVNITFTFMFFFLERQESRSE